MVEALNGLKGKKVLLLCANYFYAGKLLSANADVVVLENAQIVYETGAWNAKSYSVAEDLPGEGWSISTGAIESFGIGK